MAMERCSMTEESDKRKLTAILFVDVKGALLVFVEVKPCLTRKLFSRSVLFTSF
jgi:hypothetical protein